MRLFQSFQFGLGVDVITFAGVPWLSEGDEEAVKQVSALIDQIDIKQNIDNGISS